MLPALDAVVFTGGIGEHSGPIRKRITGRLAVLGIREPTDEAVRSDAVLGEPGDRPAVLRISAREDVMIANSVRAILEGR